MSSTINKMIRESAKSQRNAARRSANAQREHQRNLRLQRQQGRELERQQIKDQKELKAQYLESRKEETNDLNDEVKLIINEFDSVLSHTLGIDDTISFHSLYNNEIFTEFVEPQLIPTSSASPLSIIGMGKRADPTILTKIELQNNVTMANAYAQYETDKKKYEYVVSNNNKEIDNFKLRYFAGEKQAVESYNTMVLKRSDYSELFPQEFSIFYIAETKELLIEYQLPDSSVIPEAKAYNYVQSKDEIKSVEFKAKEKNEIYSRLIASISIRSIHEIFEADQANVVDSVVFNGIVETTDRATGKDIRPCLITIQTKKVEFTEFNLSKIDVIACLKGMRAQLSNSANDLSPVKPIVDLKDNGTQASTGVATVLM